MRTSPYGDTPRPPTGGDNQSAIVRVAGNIEIGLCFNLDGLRIQAAWWYAGGEEIARFRAATAAEGERDAG